MPSVQSLKFIDHPEMMAHSITERASQAIEENIYDFILLNYANADQAGHSGNINIAKQVVKLLDEEIREIVEFALKQNYTILITSDHGNIEYMVDRLTGKPQTAHDANLVPLHLVSNI
ncbi:MAG TPA: alkaline phosphatase family protein [Candidatus Paceibacterota bacterium]|nr:alkaline phosphatase family protein [Candidatus Paceibacterota bacterium]